MNGDAGVCLFECVVKRTCEQGMVHEFARLLTLQEFGVIDRNLLGNNRSWLGFADDKYAQASENVKSGWKIIKDKAQDL